MDSFIKRTGNNFDSIAVLILFAVVLLLPVFFIPTISAPFEFTKTLVLFVGVLAAFIVFVLGRLKEGSVMIPRSLLLVMVWLLPLAYFLSALLSGTDFGYSLSGRQYEVDTFAFMLVAALLTTLAAFLFREKQHIIRLYTVLLISFALVALFQIIRLFGGVEVLSFGLFTDSTSNLIGKWNDLAMFSGLVTLLSLISLEHLPLSAMKKTAVYVVLVLSLFFLALINFLPIWIIVGIFALGFFMASLMRGLMMGGGEANPHMTSRGMRQVSIPSLIVLVISVLFMFSGSTSVGGTLADAFKINHFEARPSWQTTIDIGKSTLAKSPLFGSGPNTFVEQWIRYKSTDVNLTPFWNVDFVAGIGLIPTSFVTTGILGGLAWIAFLFMFLFVGLRAMFRMGVEDSTAHFVMLSSFLSALYLWVLSVVYVPNVVVLSMAFLMTGIFIASLRHFPSLLSETELVFARNPRVGFAAVFGFTLLLLFSFGGMYLVGQKYISTVYFQKAVVAANLKNDLTTAEQDIARAIAFAPVDQYYAFATNIALIRMQEIAGKKDGDPEALRQQFQNSLAGAVANALQATRLNPANYQNWVVLGNVYRSVVPLKIDGAYENAKNSYDHATALAPKDPTIPLTLAQLEIAHGDLVAASANVAKAIELKANYLDAIFLSAQLAITAGKTAEAIKSVESAALFEPNNPVILYQLGILYYGNNDVVKSIPALERAVSLSKDYANARYFLGLAYSRTGSPDKAIQQFEEVQTLNPNNQEVAQILENLRAGKDPLPQAQVNPVKNGKTPPLEESV